MIRIRETAPPLDYSFKNLEKIDELHLQRPRRGVKRYRRTSSGRYSCTSLRLNNNQLTTIHGIHAVAYQILEQPEKLTWLDLSFNKLTSVAPEIASFPSLKILYLHGNQLSDLTASVRPLKCLDDLYSLTLHGNPVEERKGYRAKVLTSLPQLRSLDFTNVTAAELKQIQIRKSASAAAENYQYQNRVKSTF
ncbi:leucine-rich repeat-containing protein 51-like [Macrosteles quadrilineatus]|uniref:leucine-rich repeat-containing protein 51-like n=1 Tax=Macrosteles quadrilineatus TaxID=74068 RepID=UPI0023E286C6|nr:leucine-rich repeat-containing protein 51-like [Macrosteles quadrilineatus]